MRTSTPEKKNKNHCHRDSLLFFRDLLRLSNGFADFGNNVINFKQVYSDVNNSGLAIYYSIFVTIQNHLSKDNI